MWVRSQSGELFNCKRIVKRKKKNYIIHTDIMNKVSPDDYDLLGTYEDSRVEDVINKLQNAIEEHDNKFNIFPRCLLFFHSVYIMPKE